MDVRGFLKAGGRARAVHSVDAQRMAAAPRSPTGHAVGSRGEPTSEGAPRETGVALTTADYPQLADGPVPLYHQIESFFEERINAGRWRADQHLPTETELATVLNVSRGTVRLALSNLVRKGLIARKRGRGTAVAPSKILQQIPTIYRFADAVRKQGRVPILRILEARIVAPTADVRQMLRLSASDARVVSLNVLQLADDEPLILERVYLPDSIVPGILKVDLKEERLYDVMVERYGIRLSRAEETLETTVANRYEARILKIKRGDPLLLVWRTLYSSDAVVEFRKTLVRSDRCKYTTVIYPDSSQREEREGIPGHGVNPTTRPTARTSDRPGRIPPK